VRFDYTGNEQLLPSSASALTVTRGSTSLRVTPPRIHPGATVVLSGRLRGIAVAGKIVKLQAFDLGRWQEFLTASTDKQGRWRVRWRYAGTRLGRYPIRALLPAEATWPYAPGHSKTITLVVT
jgi:hypothetical protein